MSSLSVRVQPNTSIIHMASRMDSMIILRACVRRFGVYHKNGNGELAVVGHFVLFVGNRFIGVVLAISTRPADY